jgi:chaperonin cofactor prefoldin
MKRTGILFGAGLLGLVLGGGGAALQARADAADALRDVASAALQRLDKFAANEMAGVKEGARATRDLAVQLNSTAQQSALLNDRLKSNKGALEEKIDALQEQIQKLKQQADKLSAIQEKITQLLPAFMKAAENDQGIEPSQHVLAAISQDRAKAARLADAIKRRSSDEVGGLLRSSVPEAWVQVGELPGDGATVNFRIGNLVHCLSTNKKCRGGDSSLAKVASRDAPDPEATLKQLGSLLIAANRETASGNKSAEDLLAKLATAQGSSATNADRAADLQRLIARLDSLQAKSSQLSREIAAAMDRVIART